MTTTTVSSGVTLTSFTLGSGNVLTVLNGGSAVATLVQAGGIENISSGGVVISETISGGEYLLSGAVASGDIIGAGGYQLVSAGAVAKATIVNSLGALDVLGSAVSAVVNSGGTLDAFGGTVTSATINQDGTIVVEAAANGTQIGYGGAAYVLSGGRTTSSVISAGGYDAVSAGGSGASTTVLLSGVDNVESGGHVVGAQIGGAQVVFGGGHAGLSVIASGGVGFVYSGGSMSSSTVDQGGSLILLPGAKANGTVNSGGQVISTGVVEVSDVFALLAYAATDSGGALGIGNQQYVLSGGAADAVQISEGSSEYVMAGGAASGVVLYNGGYQAISSGGVAQASLIRGGIQFVASGGSASGAQVSSGGEELVSYSGAALGTVIASSGAAYVYSGGTTSGATIAKGGALYLLSGATDSGSTIASGGIEFIASGGTAANLVLAVGGQIDLASIPYTSSGVLNFNSATDVLSVTEGAGSIALQLSGSYSGDVFAAASDGSGGTLISDHSTACYCRGSMILTDQGEIPVEDLAIGDLLVARGEALRPVRWIGRRAYSGRFAASNPEVMPVLIRAGVLAEGRPNRDLLVSPQHALLIDGVLIPARAVVNGGSITKIKTTEEVEYFHLELETHDVILANGVPAETYLDDQNRFLFQNAAEYAELYPRATPALPQYCAPRLSSGPVVAAIRRRLAERGERCGYLPPGTLTVPLSVGLVSVLVPPGIGSLRLISSFGLAGRDERWLGALLSGVRIDGKPLDLADPALAEGFHDPELHETRKVRWTNGDALIHLEPAQTDLPCALQVAAVMDPSSLPAAAFTVRIDAPGTIRAIVPAGVSELRLLSSSGYAGADIRRLGALLTALAIDDDPLDLAAPDFAAPDFAQGFHPLEWHGPQPVRWTDGEALLAVPPRPVARWCEIEIAALAAPEPQLPRCQTIEISAAGLIKTTIPPGIEELRLLSPSGCVPGDARRLGALVIGVTIEGELLDPAAEAFASGFHPPERHNPRLVRWTGGEGIIQLTRQPVERSCEIEIAAVIGDAGSLAISA